MQLGYNPNVSNAVNAPPTAGLSTHVANLEDLVSRGQSLLQRARAFADHLHGSRPQEAIGVQSKAGNDSMLARFAGGLEGLEALFAQIDREFSRIETAI